MDLNYKEVFEKSWKLHSLLKNHFIKSNLNYNLCMKDEINFLDIFAPYLVLYRFPLFLDPRRKLFDKIYHIPIRNTYRKMYSSPFTNNYKNISYRSKYNSQEMIKNKEKKKSYLFQNPHIILTCFIP